MAKSVGENSVLLMQIVRALPESAIITDRTGDMLAANEAWKYFSAHVGLTPNGTTENKNLREIMLSREEPAASEYQSKIAALYSGETDEISFFCQPKTVKISGMFNVVGSCISLGNEQYFLIRFFSLFPQLHLGDSLEGKFMETIADHVPLMIGILDKDLKYCYVNNFTTEFLNCSADQILGKKIGDAFPDSEVRSVRNIVQRSLDTGSSQKINMTLNVAERSVFVETTFIPMRDSKGVPQNILIVTQDITEQISRQKDLNIARYSLQDILEKMPMPFVALGEKFEIVHMNRAACSLFGYKNAEVMGRSIDIFLPENFRKKHNVFMEDFSRAATQSLAIENRNEIQAIAKDGTEISLLGTMLKLENSDTVSYGLMLVDLTKMKSIELSLRDVENQLMQAQKHEALGQLASNIAHDFNNLLAVISGYSDLLKSNLENQPDILPMLDEILFAVNKGAGLTRQILAYTKGLEPEIRRTDLHLLLEGQLAMLKAAAGREVAIDLDFKASSTFVDLDETQFMQVLLNLTVNARDAMDGSGKITLRTSNEFLEAGFFSKKQVTAAAGEYIKLEVSDDGLGMPQEIISRVFDPYFSTKGKDKGTGLGLSVVRGIINQHRGLISCESRENAGTTFRIFLPVSAGSVAMPASTAKAGFPELREIPPEEASILVVDDEKNLREVIAAQLKSAGYQVYTAEDGSVALQFIDEFPGNLNLILSDVNMPGMSGFEMVEQATLMQPDVSVLFMTGNPQEGGQARRALSKYRLLKKPFDRESLLAEIREIFSVSQRKR